MACKTVYICDVCGTEKKETNNWFEVFESLEGGVHLEIHHFEPANDNLTVCGEQCLQRMISKWVRAGDLDSNAMYPFTIEGAS